MEIWVERNVGVTIYFPMVIAGGTDLAINTDWTPANADGNYIIDGGTPGTVTATVAYEGGYLWSLALSAAEVIGKRTQIAIVDAATKAVEDQVIMINTWGDDSSAIPLNAFADFLLRRQLASARASSRGDTAIFRSALGGFSKLVNRIYRSGSNLLITQENDTTTFGTQAMTSSASAEQITGLDTT